MKHLTKTWANQSKLVEFIFNLKEDDSCDYETIKQKSINNFKKSIAWDKKLLKLAKNTDLIERLYQAKVNKNFELMKFLPNEIFLTIKNQNILCLGYASSEDKNLLTKFAQNLLKNVEKVSKEARYDNELNARRLNLEIDFDEIIGELVLKEYFKDNDYFLEIGNNVLRVENFIIKNRENFAINKWEEENPISLWTCLYAVELVNKVGNCYDLCLLFVDGDKYDNTKFWEMTISGTNVKIYNKYLT